MKIAIIGCVKKKQVGRHRAKDLYTSPLFTLAWQYANRNFDRVFILSAKHGLLRPTQSIDSYDRTMRSMTSRKRDSWADKVAKQISQNIPPQDELHFFCGQAYLEILPKLLNTRRIYTPLQGLGLGKRLQWYKSKL